MIGGLVRGVAAGFAGTAAMTGTLTIEQAARRHPSTPVDYDASSHVVTAAAAVLHYRPRTAAGRKALFLAVHWGYGSAVGAGYVVLPARWSRPTAAAVFYLGCQAMAMTLFPTLGKTPPPWRWRPSVLASSLAQHAVYAAVVAATADLMRPRRRMASRAPEHVRQVLPTG